MVTDADLSVNLDGTTDPDRAHLRPAEPRRHAATSARAGASSTARRTSRPTCATTGQEDLRRLQSVPRRHRGLPHAAHRPARALHVRTDELPGRRPDVLPARRGRRTAASPTPWNRPSTVLTKAGNRYYDLATGQPYNPGNPFFSGPSYTLAAPDGTQYQLDAQGNIIGEITPAGRAALHQRQRHHGGQRADDPVPARTAQGRITSIVTPDGQVVNYQYDAERQPGLHAERDDRRLAALRLLALRSAPADRGRPQQRQQRADTRPARRRPPTSSATWAMRPSSRARRSTTRWPPAPPTSSASASTRASSTRPRPAACSCACWCRERTARFVPAAPTIAGLQPLLGEHAGQPSSSPCSRSTSPASTSWRSPAPRRRPPASTSLNLTVAGDLNGDGNVDGNDSALLRRGAGQHRRRRQLQPGRRHQRRRQGRPAGRGDPGERLRLPRDDRDGADHAARAAGLRSRRQLRHGARRRRHDDRRAR